MDTKSFLSDTDLEDGTMLSSVVSEAEDEKRGSPLDWWYRWAAPKEPAIHAPFTQREIARRGRLASIILLLVLIIVGSIIPVVAIMKNYPLLTGLAVGLLTCFIAFLFNRGGHVTVAGTLIIAQIIIGQTYFILSMAGSIGANNISLLDQFVIVELLAIAFLPARSVFLIALINSLIFVGIIIFQQHTLDIGQLLGSTGQYTLLLEPIILQGIVAIIAYVWARSSLNTLVQADRTDEITALEQTITEQKRQVDVGIQQILLTHVQIANGNFTARAPVARENILWQIAASLNNLLSRLQRLSQTEHELQQTRYALQQSREERVHLLEALHATRLGANGQTPMIAQPRQESSLPASYPPYSSFAKEQSQSTAAIPKQQLPAYWRKLHSMNEEN